MADLKCPECGGSVTVCDGEVYEPWFVAGRTINNVIEMRPRPCLMVGCNACEFCAEVDKEGNVVPA